MKNSLTAGHILALLTIIIWGTTFISTKILLRAFSPIEILFMRFVLGALFLLLIRPRRLRSTTIKQELTMAAAGLCGICLYYLLENIALTYTLASNVGMILSVAPFFTAIFAYFFAGGEGLHRGFVWGFVLAMSGIFLLSSADSAMTINPLGDLLALLAAVVWAIYSLLTKHIAGWGYNIILTTRRVFVYGLLFMLPMLLLMDFKPEIALLVRPVYLLNLLYLGLGASALCFVTWGLAVKLLGAVKTSVYIYMVPVITIVTSALILHERLSAVACVGVLLTLAGLFLSESRAFGRKNREI